MHCGVFRKRRKERASKAQPDFVSRLLVVLLGQAGVETSRSEPPRAGREDRALVERRPLLTISRRAPRKR